MVQKGMILTKLLGIFLCVCISTGIFIVGFSFVSNYEYSRLRASADIFSEKANRTESITELFAKTIEEKCKTNETCIVSEIESINITYRNRTLLEDIFVENLDSNFTYQIGNDCKGIAIFNAQILKNIGYEQIYFLIQDSHVCVGFRNDTEMRTLNCANETIKFTFPMKR